MEVVRALLVLLVACGGDSFANADPPPISDSGSDAPALTDAPISEGSAPDAGGTDAAEPLDVATVPDAADAGAVYSEAFTGGLTPGSQCSTWTSFRASLTGTYSKISLSGSRDAAGRTCAGATADSLCYALHAGTTLGPVSCDGNTWEVAAITSTQVALRADDGTCQSIAYEASPCAANSFWGGIDGPNCGPPSQTITVTCE